ncbi:MAG TPA: alpha-amylase family glycosyl hydrolase, partial [Candidatus Cloacimonadota bacterium]|nr:alpha-amylase family glycosyl hydrolase [Candidatus Cloacimonadota bacterium]
MKKTETIKFTYTPPTSGEHRIFLSGSFNSWKPDEIEMFADTGRYSAEIELQPGKYSYKFIVDGQWLADERADFFADDGKGGRNSVLIVGGSKGLLHVVPISYRSKDLLASVAVAGSFNNWQPQNTPLEKIGTQEYHTKLLLPPGKYEYKFVLNKTVWITDPTNPAVSYAEHDNSLLVVDDRYPLFTGREQALFTFDLVNEHFPLGEEIGNGLIRFACRTYHGNTEQVVLLWNDTAVEMPRYFSETNFDYYSVILPKTDTWQFQVKLVGNGSEAILQNPDTGGNNFRIKPHPNNLEWIQKGIIYQIFCDRFCNGDANLNPDFAEWYYDPAKNRLTEAVRNQTFRFEPNWQNNQVLKDDPHKNDVFFGGDLPGVLQKIPYLKDLGITCLYFNPLTLAASN